MARHRLGAGSHPQPRLDLVGGDPGAVTPVVLGRIRGDGPHRTHRHPGSLALGGDCAGVAASLAGVLDVLRFTQGQGWAAWANFLVIWDLPTNSVVFYDRSWPPRPERAGMMFWAGLFALIALTNMGFLPAGP